MQSVPTAAEEEAIQSVAAEWIVRIDDAELSPGERRAFEGWRTADERHDRAFAALQALWDEIPAIESLAARFPLAVNDDDRSSLPRTGRRSALGWLGGLAAAAAAALALVFGNPAPPEDLYVTQVAQISEISLADGSVATLGPRTRMVVAFTEDERRVRLVSGEAFFKVAKNAERPFLVQTGASAVRVVGTQFNVRRGHGVVQVAVLEGAVQIRGDEAGAASKPLDTLYPGDRADVTAGRQGTVVRKLARSGDLATFRDAMAGWRAGWLTYENARLGDVVADMNRYYRPGVVLDDPALADLRVTASFKAEGIPQFVRSTDRLFPVIVEQRPGGVYRIGPR